MHTLATAGDSIWSDMFTFQIPATEKILRTIFVYAAVALLIRLFGRRILAQLNLSDLVVVLLLSNVVQNAIIGDDNSLSGGLLGALTLVLVDYLFDRVAFMIKGSERFFDGKPITVVKDGQVDSKKLAPTRHPRRRAADRPAPARRRPRLGGRVCDAAAGRCVRHGPQAGRAGRQRRASWRRRCGGSRLLIDERFSALEARIPSSRE